MIGYYIKNKGGEKMRFNTEMLNDYVNQSKYKRNSDIMFDLAAKTHYKTCLRTVDRWREGFEPRATAVYALSLLFNVPMEKFFVKN